ncbi:MAG: hypothetical protein ABI593_10290 [Betaproteobacteria bacterium]
MTPYERLTSILGYASTLRPELTAETLQQLAVTMIDNAAAKHVQDSRAKLFGMFNRRPKVAA